MYLFEHTAGDRGIFDLDGLMHPADTESAEISDLPLGFSILGDDLCNSELCHISLLLSVKHFAHGNTAETGHCVGVSHLGKGCDSSLNEVVRVG